MRRSSSRSRRRGVKLCSEAAEKGPSAEVRRPRPHARRTGSTPRARPSGAASPLDLFERPGEASSTLLGVTALLAAGAVLLAAFIKGAIGFGFPTLGTPLLSLVMDVK